MRRRGERVRPEPATVERVDVGSVIRAIRRTRRLSQRELASLAGVPPSTICRAEAGHGEPRLDTFLGIIGAAGFGFALVDGQGRPLRLDPEHDRLRHADGSHFPAHLPWADEPDYIFGRPWWGWHRVAFWPSRDNVPDHVFWHRRTLERLQGCEWERTDEHGRVWDDAT